MEEEEVLSIYVCPVCGYDNHDQLGDPEHGIAPGTKWEDIPDTWTCPVCGADKQDFVLQRMDPSSETNAPAGAPDDERPRAEEESFGNFSAQELAALFANLAKGCQKQHRTEEEGLFNKLSDYYQSRVAPVAGEFSVLLELARIDLETVFPQANQAASGHHDRGALRALTWSDKVTRILISILRKGSENMRVPAKDDKVFVCEISSEMKRRRFVLYARCPG